MNQIGVIVKSKLRTEWYPLFLMTIEDPNPSINQFKAVVLLDKSDFPDEPGTISDAWNTSLFEVSSWQELKKFI